MNDYFNWPTSPNRLVRFDTARAEDVNGALDTLSTGLDTLADDINRALKLPTGTADQTLSLTAGARAGLTLGFDAAGNMAAVASGGRYRGDWATATQYVPSDTFRDPTSGSIYAALLTHVSTSVAADETATKIRVAIDVASVEADRIAAEAAASTATTKASEASASASTASGSASTATTKAGEASTHATNASASATTASTKADEASASAASAAASFDSFDDRYLGSKSSNPSADNDGNALLTGAAYWNSTSNELRIWNGSTWNAAVAVPPEGVAGGVLSGSYPNPGFAVDMATQAELNAVSGAMVTASSTTTLTNKTISGADNTLTADGTNAVGFRTIPQNSQSTAYTCVLTDSGKHILHPSADTTARTFTIPANSSVAYPIGTAITFVNQASAGVVTISITTDTMRLAGAGTTGSRTLAANGVATAIKLTATEWLVSGTGLT